MPRKPHGVRRGARRNAAGFNEAAARCRGNPVQAFLDGLAAALLQ